MSQDGKESAYPVRRPDLHAPVPPKLVADVFATLAKHGFPDMANPADYSRMRTVLDDFLYTAIPEPAGDVRTVTRHGVSVRQRIGTVAAGASVVGLQINGAL